MTHGSLFSGIGGFDLAAEWMGWENLFHCEYDPWNRKILNHYWKNAKSYEDIRKTDFSIWRGKIDILTGGFPCQPFSTAGKRKGTEDERHLWPEMLRAIQEIAPVWIVGENVRGIVNWSEGLVFEQVCADLEAEGYEVQAFVLPAAAVNAPHRRDRVWFVAYSDKNSNIRKSRENERESREERIQERHKIWQPLESDSFWKNAAHSKQERLERMHKAWGEINKNGQNSKVWRGFARCHKKGIQWNAANTMLSRGEKDNWARESRLIDKTGSENNWEKFPTQSPICGGDDGIPTELDNLTVPKWRKQSLMAYGNAIVPQVAYQIFQSIEQYNQLK